MDHNEERWMQLCQLASVETDPQRLLKLVEEINRLLEERSRALNPQKKNTDP